MFGDTHPPYITRWPNAFGLSWTTVGGTVGFKCNSPEQVREFHDVAVANGGTSIEEPPGPRSGPTGVLHLAYVRDPDGNKLCALYRPKA